MGIPLGQDQWVYAVATAPVSPATGSFRLPGTSSLSLLQNTSWWNNCLSTWPLPWGGKTARQKASDHTWLYGFLSDFKGRSKSQGHTLLWSRAGMFNYILEEERKLGEISKQPQDCSEIWSILSSFLALCLQASFSLIGPEDVPHIQYLRYDIRKGHYIERVCEMKRNIPFLVPGLPSLGQIQWHLSGPFLCASPQAFIAAC